MEAKVCKKCGEEKLFSSFVKNKHCKNGITNECMTCANIRQNDPIYKSRWFQLNKERTKEKRKESSQKYNQSEKGKIKRMKYYSERKAIINKRAKEWHRANSTNPKIRERSNLRNKKAVDDMKYWYVLSKLSRQLKVSTAFLKGADIKDYIETYKGVLRLKRAIKNHGKE